MIKATIHPLQDVQRGNFYVTISLDKWVDALEDANVCIQAVAGNGIDGIEVDVSGLGTDWGVSVGIPEEVEGTLKLSISGTVLRDGEPEAITSEPIVVAYSSIISIRAVFRDPRYKDRCTLVLPIVFADQVLADSKSMFNIQYVSGDDLSDITYSLTGDGMFYALEFDIPKGRAGKFEVRVDGDVIRNNVLLTVRANPVIVAYDTTFDFIAFVRRFLGQIRMRPAFQKSSKHISSKVQAITEKGHEV